MNSIVYEERCYRAISRPNDLLCYEVKIKETDLFCCTKKNLKTFIEERALLYRYQLEEYIKVNPMFRDSFIPIEHDAYAPHIVRQMIAASSLIGVGPMATVAGAIAEFIGRDIAPYSEEYIIENGGDIYLYTRRERVILVHAKNSPFSERIGIKLKPDNLPYGICTSSGTVGHSVSFGNADAVCIIGTSSLLADGLATLLGNSVKNSYDIQPAIEKGKRFSGIKGIVIILGKHMGVWGDVEIIDVVKQQEVQ